MKISVVIPTYKRTLLLMECLAALARQRFPHDEFEVIVVSDGPDRLTRQIVDSWCHTRLLDVTYLPLSENRGPAAARNAGWKLASGELIAFTDDDTQPDPHWLSELWENAAGQPPAAYTGRIIVPITEAPTDYELNTAQLETAEFVTANCACSRTVLESTGGFDERYRMAWREDSDLYFSIRSAGFPVEHIPEAIVVHPVRKATWGVSFREQKKTMFNALLFRKFPDLYRKEPHPFPPGHYYAMALLLPAAFVCAAFGETEWAAVLFGGWAGLIAMFAVKRLRRTSRSWAHVLEMMLTSATIPPASIFWYWYGWWKFRLTKG
ncbi:glycosyltransferase family 2 protein [Chitinophaga sp. NPDC101104]|uniref:glycosyltransferase family 2 protein n=1 Tax=Chitinophaga sp. NPDC101104 TaxID=3390561 RepID=UPI003D06ADE0